MVYYAQMATCHYNRVAHSSHSFLQIIFGRKIEVSFPIQKLFGFSLVPASQDKLTHIILNTLKQTDVKEQSLEYGDSVTAN